MADAQLKANSSRAKPSLDTNNEHPERERRGGKANTASASSKGKNASKKEVPLVPKTNEIAEMLTCPRSIQEFQKDTANRMEIMAKRIDDIENSEYPEYPYENEYEGYEDCDYDDADSESFPPSKKQRTDSHAQSDDNNDDIASPFSSLSKRFKNIEMCGDEIDPVLSQNDTDLFRKGMDADQYEKMIKDENTPRPSNCDGLRPVRMNRLVWDWMSPQARTNNHTLQKTATSVVKAAVILTKTVDKVAKMEKTLRESVKDIDLSPIIEGCNEALALLGHSNHQNCMVRRDFLKPELTKELQTKCNHAIPYTHELFGDDVSKTAKEIEDSSRMGQRMHRGFGPYRSSYRSRSHFRGRARTRSRGARGLYAPQSFDGGKNFQRQGSVRGYRN